MTAARFVLSDEQRSSPSVSAQRVSQTVSVDPFVLVAS
jgi:hypothetical protein